MIPKEWVTTPTDRESRGVMTPLGHRWVVTPWSHRIGNPCEVGSESGWVGRDPNGSRPQ